MKARPHKRQVGIRRPPKRAARRARGVEGQIIGRTRPSPIEFSDRIDDEEALVAAESLDERERRG